MLVPRQTTEWLSRYEVCKNQNAKPSAIKDGLDFMWGEVTCAWGVGEGLKTKRVCELHLKGWAALQQTER